MAKFYTYLFLTLTSFLGIQIANAQNTVVTAAPAVTNACVGGGYITLGDIKITETNFANFNNGPNQTYILSVPANFEFNTGVTPTVTASAGTGVSGISVSAPTLTTFTFQYDVSPGSTGAGPFDEITISGIQVRAITSPSSGALARSGGTAIMAGNGTGAQVHCMLTSASNVSITSQPVNNNVCATLTNQTIFSVVASGSGLTYSWERDNLNPGDGTGFDPISSAAPGSYTGYNTATLINNTNNTTQNGFLFRCVISGGCSGPVTSNTATLSVATATTVTSNPSNQNICSGNATFTVGASTPSAGTNVYQWYENGSTLLTNTGVYSGVNTATLTLTNPPAGMSGRTYHCVVSNTICGATSPSSAASLTINSGPVITSQPIDKVGCVNDDPTFSVVASGSGLTYQWQRSNDGGATFQNAPSAYSNTTTATMTADNIGTIQNGYLFRCIVSTPSCGSVTSDTAMLTVYSSGTVNYFGLGTSYCYNAAPVDLSGFPAGGTFSGSGVTDLGGGNAKFDPHAVPAAGIIPVTYTLGCVVSKNTTVKDTTKMAFTSPANANPTYASTDPPVDLIVQTIPPSGALVGTFTGNGVSGTKFYPNIAGAGNQNVTFTFTNPNGCVNSINKSITVTSPGLGIPQLRNGSPFCQGGAYIMLSDTSVDGPTPAWGGYMSFAGFSGKGITYVGGMSGYEYKFSPDSAGSYAISYNVLYDFGFFSFTLPYASQTITVNPQTAIDFNLPTDVCRTSGSINLNPFPGVLAGAAGTGISIISPASPPGGMLSGANNTTFNPSASGLTATNYTVRYTFVNGTGCYTRLDKQINVFPKPAVPVVLTPSTFWGVQDEEFCYGTSRKVLGATKINPNLVDFSSTYTWYDNAGLVGSPVSNQYYLFPQATDNNPGTYHYYVTRTEAGCTSDPLTVNFTINDAAIVNAGTSQTVCEGNTVTLSGTSNRVVAGSALGATWSAPFATGSSFSPNATTLTPVYTPTATDINNQYVDLTLTSNDPDGTGPCPVSSQSVRVYINKAATVDAGAATTYCSNNLISLAGTFSTFSAQWTGGTPGGIANPFSPTTTYTPSPSEKTGGAITFTLTTSDPDGAGPCQAASDNVIITINPEPLVEAGPDQTVCRSSSTVVNITGASRSGGSNSATWTGGTMGFGAYTPTNSNLSTTYTPSVAELPVNGGLRKTIKLYLTSDDPDGTGLTGPCGIAKDSMLVFINPLPQINSVIVPDTAFCRSESSFQIVTSASSSYGIKIETFLDPNPVNTGITGNYFAPNIANPGPHTIRYQIQDFNDCINYKDTLIYIYKTPKPDIVIAKYCATAPTIFDGQNSGFPVLVNDNDNASNITSYFWKFGDFNNSLTDTSSLKTTSYTYPKTLNPSAKQSYFVKLMVGTNKGCFAEKDTTITIGNIPETDFSWSGICPIDVTKYVDISGFPFAEVNNYTWKFDSEATFSGSTLAYKNYNYKFVGGTGAYNVTYKILSKIGCVDSMTHTVHILDQYKPNALDPYTTNFVSTDAYWAVDGQNPSWQWGAANKTNITTGSRNTWVTNTVGPYNVNEKSYLNGPCLNFVDLKKPMVALKIWSATQNPVAGTALQYSTDGGLTWKIIGDVTTGLNWYDALGIVGNPGNQSLYQYGWTGQYSGWKIAKINLNNLADSLSVRLRLAFGSGPITLNLQDGFAIDSIWVGERDKLLLVENFTNSSTNTVVTSDANLNTLVNNRSNDVVAIHYHTGFPGTDPMNLRNQADPSARVLNYGVPQVPYKVFDGNYDYGATLDNADIDRRSLDLARFSIKLGTQFNTGSVDADIRIIAKDTITSNFVVHAAVIERHVTGLTVGNSQTDFEWVETRMLPDAGGTFYTQDFAKNDSSTFHLHWDYFPTEVYDPNQLAIVAFVQDVKTKEVYQAAYQLGPAVLVNGLKNQKLAGKELLIYPNPSQNETNVIFDDFTQDDYDYEVVNELGNIVDNGVVEKGSSKFIIRTEKLPSGLYVVKIGNERDGYAFKKVIVTH